MTHGIRTNDITFSNGHTLASAPDVHANEANTVYTKLVSVGAYECGMFLQPNGDLISWAASFAQYGSEGSGISQGSASQRGYPIVVQFPASETGKIVYARAVGLVSYARFDNGNLYAWGYGANGANAFGSFTSTNVPKLVATNVAHVELPTNVGFNVGAEHVAIIKTDGTLWMVGYNAVGALGDTTSAYRASFVQITSVAANTIAQTAEKGYAIWLIGVYSYGMTVIQKTDGTIWFTGRNNAEYNTTGIPQEAYDYYGNTRYRNVDALYTFTDITAYWGGSGGGVVWNVVGCGGYYDSGVTPEKNGQNLIILRSTNTASNATIYCGGINTSGQCKNGTYGNTGTVNSFTLGTGAVGQLRAMGGVLSCYYIRNGVLYTWGYGGNNQTGDGTGGSRNTEYTRATSPAGYAWDKCVLDYFDAHTYGYTGTMFIKDVQGNVYSFGYNGYGQRANGNTTSVTTPTECPELKNAISISGNGYGTGHWYIGVLPHGTRSQGGRVVKWGYGNQYQIDHCITNGSFTKPVEVITQHFI
jgi:alpha-tubulin suppressor-like RCC1 family protein